MSANAVMNAIAALDLELEIGRSSQGRAIAATRLGPARGAPALLVVGGVHGDEPSSVDACVALVRRLRAGLTASGPLWVVPALNPDGLVHGTKNSGRDVDLNRNFPATSFRRDHRPGYDPGSVPLSEPETRALAALLERAQIRRVVAVHAPLGCINFDGPAGAWAAAVARRCGWPARGDIGHPTPGSLGNWLGVDGGMPVLTLELPSGPYASFQPAADAALDESVCWSPNSSLNPPSLE